MTASESTQITTINTEPKAQIALVSGKVGGGIQPQTYDDVIRLANMVVTAGLVPGDMTAEKAKALAVTKILFGMEMGLTPMTALQGIYIGPGGLPGAKAELIQSQIQNSGRYKYETLEYTDEKVSVKFFEKEEGKWKEKGIVSLTWKEVETRILPNSRNANTWKTWKRNMMFKQCIQDGRKVHCGGLFGGMVVLTEDEAKEAEDVAVIQSTPVTASKHLAQEIAEAKAKAVSQQVAAAPAPAPAPQPEAQEQEATDVESEPVAAAPPPVAAQPVTPTLQEKLEAAAEVARIQGAPEDEQKTLQDAAKGGVTNKQCLALVATGKINGWTNKSVTQLAMTKFNLTSNWNKEISERQYNTLLDFVTNNKPEVEG